MKSTKFLILIPIILISYVAYANLVTVADTGKNDTHSYFIDIGSENDTIGDAKLTGPMDRISIPFKGSALPSNITYRELTNNLVYFQITHSDLINHSKVNVHLRFKDNFPQISEFKIGARNKEEWSFYWKTIYDPFQAVLEDNFHLISGNDSYHIYSVNDPDMVMDVSNFLLHPPSGSTIAVEPGINVNKRPNITINKDATLTINKTLRGGHTFYTYIDDETLEFNITKQDLNWYKGSDDLKITVYSESGEEKGNITIPDDGDITKSSAPGPKQTGAINISDLQTGVYKIVMSGGEDLYIHNIATVQDKLVIANRMFLISPAEIYTGNTKEVNLGFLTYHDSAFQDIWIQNHTLAAPVIINRVATQYKMDIFPSMELYNISLPIGDMIITSGGYFAFTSDSYFDPFRCSVLTLQKDMDWVGNNGIDYIVMNSLNTTNDNGWVTADVEWDIKDLVLKKDTLEFTTNTDHFKNYPNSTIPLDWISITLT